ncbi:MAG: hypothetical protein JXA68_07100 [Ignavibacteriales bacterium]|nr:hypothetical protein [Ignavibacteriales bacterium]
MKKQITILILVLLPLVGFGQRKLVTTSDGFPIVFLKNSRNYALIKSTVSSDSLMLSLNAKNISPDSLTYNSTGYYVISSSGVNVNIDGSSDVVIGNSVRFGSPTTGSIYQIVDTGATAANLVLNKTFSGSTSDEFFWGGVGKWYDESTEENNALQTTATQQPKLLWAESNSACVNFDGIDDRFIITEIVNNNNYSIYFKLKRNQLTTLQCIFGHNVNVYSRFMYGLDNSILFETNTNANGFSTVGTAFTNITTFDDYVFNVTENEASLYYENNSIFIDNTTLTDAFSINKIGSTAALYYINADIKEIMIFKRSLSREEIQILSE